MTKRPNTAGFLAVMYDLVPAWHTSCWQSRENLSLRWLYQGERLEVDNPRRGPSHQKIGLAARAIARDSSTFFRLLASVFGLSIFSRGA
jgi:hypothetical protein